MLAAFAMVATLAHLGSIEELELELARRAVAKAQAAQDTALEGRVAEMLGDIHPEARAVIDDKARLVAVRGTRRSGKSRSFIRKMLEVGATVPHARVFYFNETIGECERIVWVGNGRDGLLTLNDQFQLGGHPNQTKHTLTFPRGGVIELIGADDLRSVNKARGTASHLVVIDEAQKMPHLQTLIQDSLGASMLDYGGQIVLAGTPSEDMTGLFPEVTSDEAPPPAGWSTHVLNVTMNPFFGATPEERFARTVVQFCQDHGLDLDHPTVQREWFAKWVKEDARFTYAVHQVPEHKLCYAPPRWKVPPVWRKDSTGRPLFLEGGVVDWRAAIGDLPQGPEWRFTIGVDLGYLPDPFAWVLWAWSWEWDELLEVASWAKTALDSDEQLTEMMAVAQQAPPSIVTGDIGGAATPIGKGWSKRWSERFGYGLVEAEKHRKFEHLQLFNTDLRKGRVRLRKGSPLHEQMKRVKWLPRAGSGRLQEDPSIPNDVTDAGLYGHRHTFQHLAERKVPTPPVGSAEYYTKLEAELEGDDDCEQEPESYYG